MNREAKTIDISNEPALLRLAEEVRSSNEPRLLRRDNEDVAIIVPAKRRRARPDKTTADEAAFRSAFGAWRDLVDAETLKANLASTRGSDRPSVGP